MMKAFVEVQQITLQVHEHEMTFSEGELKSILEEYFDSKVKKAEGGKDRQEKDAAEKVKPKYCEGPTEGKAFEVNPSEIERSLFSAKRKDEKQERTRQLILKAFAKVDANPEKYGKPFKTLMLEKTWKEETVKRLEELANSLGDHLADGVEQTMEWAQRIANGETWEAVCNEPDTANWYRLVKWEGYYRNIGGSRNSIYYHFPAAAVSIGYDSFSILNCTVPLVVLY